MHTVSSVEINVNWNGVRNSFFYPQHGIHQGDLISPYLFVLCMDKLSHLIEQEVRSKNWKVINLGRQGAMILHLMFTDGLLLFGESTKKQMKCVIDTLNLFCSMPSQEVSHEKTNTLFSKNISRSMQMKLSQLSCFRVTSSFGKYLGVPFSGKKLRRNEFQYIVDHIALKLTNWKKNNLFFARRVTLAKSVIEIILLYPVMTNRLPKS